MEALEAKQREKYQSRLESLQKDKLQACRIFVDSSKSAGAVFAAASSAKKLATLEILGPGLCDSSASALVQFLTTSPSLTYLGVFDHKFDEKSLTSKHKSYSIVLTSSNILQTFIELAKGLAQAKCLRQLVIDRPASKVNMDPVSSEIAQSITKNTTINTLRIMGNSSSYLLLQ